MKEVGYMTKIISISSISGGGKTTIINALKNALPKSVSLHFDDYSFDENIDYEKWIESGGDYNDWDLALLKNDIDRLIKKTEVDYVLLDYPFAYKNDLINPYIDVAIYIDTPLDVALGRRIVRDMKNSSNEEIRAYVDRYVKYERPLYQFMLDTIPPNSDMIVDGTKSVDEIVEKILQEV